MSKILALGGGALVGLACFLPLFSLTVSFGEISANGSAQASDFTAGKVALVLAFASLLLAVIDIRGGEGTYRRPAAGCAIVGAAIVVYKSLALAGQFNDPALGTGIGHASPGIGMWVAFLGGAIAVASALTSRA
jgi:hypothetical protein